MKPFDVFGKAAACLSSPTLIAGRRAFQAQAEESIVADVVAKLGLSGAETLLEVGCGVGTLLTPLAVHVSTAIGIDHPSCLDKYRTLGVPQNITLVGGEWPYVPLKQQVDRVLVYSVIQLLPDASAAQAFVEACVAVLRPGGYLLLGDLPNEDKRRRFQQSGFGARFHAEYRKRVEVAVTQSQECRTQVTIFAEMDSPGDAYISDAFVFQLMKDMRAAGNESYLLPQPVELPFHYTREDMLICKGRGA